MAPLALALACHGRARSSGGSGSGAGLSNSVAEFDLSGGVPESISGGLFQPPVSRTYVALARSVERVAGDPDITGAFVKLGGASLDWAQTEELAGLFDKLKKKGKPVVCHAHVLSNASAAFALRACTRTWLSPAGDAETVGIAAQIMYMRGLFDKLKVGVDFLHVGKFKSGVEPFTREGPSEPARESLTETLRAIRDAWLDQATQAGKPDSVRAALEQGPWSPEDAKKQGLIDAVGYESEALTDAKKLSKAEEVSGTYGGKSNKGSQGLDIAQLVRIIAGSEESAVTRPHIAVLPAEGSIAMEAGGALSSGGITASAIGKTLRRLKNDEHIKAVVLRIDSPGGSALASDLIWHELRELQKKKPLVVSVGGMAASGGYYMACAGDRIFAEPTSIVGSIGVFGGKIVFSSALEEFGVHTETFPASPEPGAAARASSQSPFSTWDDPTREKIRAGMQSVYDLFISRVAAGRKLTTEKVEEVAQGRIWSGKQGLERGLVDQLGGVVDAIAHARKLAGLPEDAPVTVEGGQDSLLDMLLVSQDANEEQVKQALVAYQARSLVIRELPPALRRYASALGPLAAGERVVAALPFGISLE
ncbi:MAG TPA: signal peptide peptidase SppA [Polyangiaceae bacterium]|nr:signal peptide peptidase SppA [Polyangiaceae bacterium]